MSVKQGEIIKLLITRFPNHYCQEHEKYESHCSECNYELREAVEGLIHGDYPYIRRSAKQMRESRRRGRRRAVDP